mmetsp:Transcript_17213/g.30943  ORF Transcript_17213/g.30943 Transcript_17213/m.30943 type:complete len:702 (-) Transcript_17213:6403-8508(-)
MEDFFNTAFDDSSRHSDFQDCGEDLTGNLEESRDFDYQELLKTAVIAKLLDEKQRLFKFHEESLELLTKLGDELSRQLAEFVHSSKAKLTKQVEVAGHELEAALQILANGNAPYNPLTSQLLNLSSGKDIDKVELLKLSFSVSPCNIGSVLDISAQYSVQVVHDIDLKEADLSLVKSAEKEKTRSIKPKMSIVEALNGEFEQFDVSKIKLEISKIEKPKTKITTPTAYTAAPSSKRSSKQPTANSSPVRPKKGVPAESKLNTSKTIQKQISLIDVKSSSIQPAKTKANIHLDLEPKTSQHVSRIQKPVLTRKLSSELDDSLSFSNTSRTEPKQSHFKESRSPAVEPRQDKRKRASTAIISPKLEPFKRDKSQVFDTPVESLEALTERPLKRQKTVAPNSKEEFKTAKPRTAQRQSLQLKPTDLSFKTSAGLLKSPMKELRSLVTPRTPLSPNSIYQTMNYLIPGTSKILTLTVETEAVVTVDMELSDVFVEGAAWCETNTQELLYTGGLADAPLNKARLILPHRRSNMEVTPMLTARHSHQLVSIQDLIFAIGGAGPEPLDDCEYFSMRCCSWKKAGSLNFARAKPAACVHNNRIFVAGGTNQDSIEVYDIVEEQFSLMFMLLPSPGYCSMTTYNDNLIILQNDKVIELDPTSSTMKELCSWKQEPCWSASSIVFKEGLVYMTVQGEFIRFNIRTQTVEKL